MNIPKIVWKRRLSALLCIFLSVLLLVGCRESPSLEQIVYTQDASEVDPDQQALDPEEEGQEDERFTQEMTEDADTQRDTEEALAAADPEGQDDAPASDIRYSDTGVDDYPAEEKPQSGDAPQGSSGQEAPKETPQESSGQGESQETPQENSGQGESQETPEGKSGQEPPQEAPQETVGDAAPVSTESSPTEELPKEKSENENDKNNKNGKNDKNDKNDKSTPSQEPTEKNGGLDELGEVDDQDETPQPTNPEPQDPGETGTPNSTGNPDDPDNPMPEITEPGDEPKKQIVDESGSQVEVPQDVQTVTAVGAAASMVEMLGGSGRLVGSGSDFTSNSIAMSVFADLGSVNTWWEGSGKSPISDTAFASLLSVKPDVCFEMSGDNTFTKAQVGQLQDAGIAHFVLPGLSSVDNLKLAVRMMAEILGTTSAGDNSQEIAESYCSWVDSVLANVQGQNSDTVLSSLYISGWVDTTYTLYGNASKLPPEAGLVDGAIGTGAAVAWSSRKQELVSTFMQAAGVTNESSANTSQYRYTDGTYVMPMFTQFDPVFSDSTYSFYREGIAEGYDLFLCSQRSAVLGDAAFPAIIVSDDYVKSRIEGSWFWQYHGGVQTATLNWQYGFSYGDELFYAGVAGDYSIFVNPSGVGDWAEGCVESPLEAYWVAYKFSGQYGLDMLYSEVASFYRTYFGAELSSEQIAAILRE